MSDTLITPKQISELIDVAEKHSFEFFGDTDIEAYNAFLCIYSMIDKWLGHESQQEKIQSLEAELEKKRTAVSACNSTIKMLHKEKRELEAELEKTKQDDLHQLQEIRRLHKVVKTSNINRQNAEKWAETLEKQNAELRKANENLDFKVDTLRGYAQQSDKRLEEVLEENAELKRTIEIERLSAQKHYSSINNERHELQDKNAELRREVERLREVVSKVHDVSKSSNKTHNMLLIYNACADALGE